MLGREVLTQVNQKKNAGIHEVKFDAADLPSDVYLYSLVAGHFVQTRKMIVIKQGFPIPEDPGRASDHPWVPALLFQVDNQQQQGSL